MACVPGYLEDGGTQPNDPMEGRQSRYIHKTQSLVMYPNLALTWIILAIYDLNSNLDDFGECRGELEVDFLQIGSESRKWNVGL